MAHPEMRVAVEIEGIHEFIRKAARIADPKTQAKILKSTLTSGANPIKTALRQQIRRVGAIRKRHLYRAVTHKFKVYQGTPWLGIGIRDKKVDGENPGKYFHLVDLGTKPHTINRDEPQRVKLNGRWYILQGPYQHTGAKSKPIREPALKAAGAKVVPAMAKRFARLMEKEALKRR